MNADGFVKALEECEKMFQNHGIKAMGLILSEIQKNEKYPSQPSRTRANTFNTYVRGVGDYPKSSFVQDTQFAGGFRVKLTKRAKIKYTSEQMDRNFKWSVTSTADKIIGNIHNDASYSGYVIGEQADQTSFHADTGWLNEEDVVDMVDIDKIFEKSIDGFMDDLSNV